jgi:alkanesulfonate monooxygenase
MAAERIAKMRRLAAEQGRSLRFGIRPHVIARHTAEAAWAEAERMLDELPDEVVERVQSRMDRAGALGHQRIRTLRDGTKHNREAMRIYPNLWAGTSLIFGNPALVGSFSEIAERIREYQDIGIEHFILSGYPRLEERLLVR